MCSFGVDGNSDLVLTFFAIIKNGANYAHRKISSVMSQIYIQVILFLYFGQKNHRML